MSHLVQDGLNRYKVQPMLSEGIPCDRSTDLPMLSYKTLSSLFSGETTTIGSGLCDYAHQVESDSSPALVALSFRFEGITGVQPFRRAGAIHRIPNGPRPGEEPAFITKCLLRWEATQLFHTLPTQPSEKSGQVCHFDPAGR